MLSGGSAASWQSPPRFAGGIAFLLDVPQLLLPDRAHHNRSILGQRGNPSVCAAAEAAEIHLPDKPTAVVALGSVL